MKLVKPDGVRRAPLISFPEIAERYGLTMDQLRTDFTNPKVPSPTIALHHKGSPASLGRKARWYKTNDVAAWRKAVLASREPFLPGAA